MEMWTKMEFWLDVESNINSNGNTDGIMWKSRQKQKTPTGTLTMMTLRASEASSRMSTSRWSGYICTKCWCYETHTAPKWENKWRWPGHVFKGGRVRWRGKDRADSCHTSRQGRAHFIYCKVKNYCVARSSIHFRYYKWCLLSIRRTWLRFYWTARQI